MIFDAGVFIALENPAQRRVVLELVRTMRADGVRPVTNEAVLAQAWRDPATQVPMTLLVRACDVHPFGDSQVIGRRCAASGTGDVVDGSLAVLASQLGERILTTDPDDMRRLDAPHESL